MTRLESDTGLPPKFQRLNTYPSEVLELLFHAFSFRGINVAIAALVSLSASYREGRREEWPQGKAWTELGHEKSCGTRSKVCVASKSSHNDWGMGTQQCRLPSAVLGHKIDKNAKSFFHQQ